MILKYHTEVPDAKEAVLYYCQLFDGTMLKDGSTGHGSLHMFNQIPLMVYKQVKEREKVGSHVFRFNDNELELFDKILERVKADPTIVIKYDLQSWSWETTELIKFEDKYGYTWVLERNTQTTK